VGDTQTLLVEVELQGSGYRILRWQTAPAGNWQTEERLPVWDGE